jgi:hypothetical protein
MRRLLQTSAGLAIALSVAHTLVALATFERLSAAALWFASAGLLLLCAALLNLAAWGQPPRRGPTLRVAVHGANLLLVGFGAAATWVLGPGPAYAVLLAMIGLLVAGVGLDRTAAASGPAAQEVHSLTSRNRAVEERIPTPGRGGK